MMKTWVNPKNRRYYNALLQPDLFGRWSLMRNWGSLDNGRGQVRIETVSGPASGQRKMDAIHKRRIAHGYRPVRNRPY
ncbi:MAG: WGR domain-containing protein [Pseudomonadota bacterium]